MKFFLNRLADIVSVFHVAVILVAAFGWWLIPNHPIHFAVLFLTWLSWVTIGECVLAKLEYKIRSYNDPSVHKYENGYLHYHMHKFSSKAPSLKFIRFWGLIYLTSGCFLWIINYFVVYS